jgi:GNAT superfamily N-acetyltransferase
VSGVFCGSVRSVEILARAHHVDGFTSGSEPLDMFRVRYALLGQLANTSPTYRALASDRVVGFSTLVFGQVARDTAPPRVAKGLPRYPVPVMVLARLTVASDMRRQGIGSGMLKDAVLRTLQAADIAGLRAFVAHAKDESARAFYERFDFVPSPSGRRPGWLRPREVSP